MKTARAPRNRTLTLTSAEERHYNSRLVRLSAPLPLDRVIDRTINQDMMEAIGHLPTACVDLLLLDPPYNLAKSFNGKRFPKQDVSCYSAWMSSWFQPLLRLLKKTASVYVCGDWLTSVSIYEALSTHLQIRNRISWEREKGRGAKTNWKNCSEDIWYATASNKYTFNVDAVKLKRKVIAPYRVQGEPKDWEQSSTGNFRLTSPSNLWSDITVPFWSMPENTDHPTQKPEKLLAKLVLASSSPGEVVLDPFLGSGTTSVVARKLGRRFLGIEVDTRYCCLAEKRLEAALTDPSIQGYADGVFWERNTLQEQTRKSRRSQSKKHTEANLFGD